MHESKTHFEQIPVEIVKKIAEDFHDDVVGNNDGIATTSPNKLKPHRTASLRKQRKASLTMQVPAADIKCSICGKPVTLETAKTDEVGHAAHGECYLFKLGINADRSFVQAPKEIQSNSTP